MSTPQNNTSAAAPLASISAVGDGDTGPRRLYILRTSFYHRTTLADTRSTTVHTITEAGRGRPGFLQVPVVAFRSSIINSLRNGTAQVDSLFDLSSQAELRQRLRSQLTQSGLGVLSARLVGLNGDGNRVGEARGLQDHLAA